MGLIPQLNYFCCGCSLKHGTLIVLILPLICIILFPFVDTKIYYKGQTLFQTILAFIILVAVCVAGLYGVHKQSRGFLIPFLVVDVWMIIGGLIFCIQSFFSNIAMSLLVFLFLPVYGYAFLVVLSYYHEMGISRSTASTTAA